MYVKEVRVILQLHLFCSQLMTEILFLQIIIHFFILMVIKLDIAVNFHHFLHRQFPVEEDQFIQIHPGVFIILIHVTFP